MVIAGFSQLTFAFGLIGNLVSFMVLLYPLPQFYEVYKKKTTEGIKSLPYVVGLFTSLLWMYYALIKGDGVILNSIRSVGVVIQTFYLCVFAFHAPKKAMLESLKLIMMFIVIGFGLIVILSQLLTKGTQRDVIVGWVVLVLTSLCVFVTPSSVLTQVIKTKSVKYMPILLVLLVTLSGFVWFFYGLLLGDLIIMVPNALGFTLGVIQIIYYVVYRNVKADIDDNTTENDEQMISEIDEPGNPKVKDQNASIDSENVANPHGSPVVVINHTIDIPV